MLDNEESNFIINKHDTIVQMLKSKLYKDPITAINHASILITVTNTIHLLQNILHLSIFYEQLN